MHPNAAYRRMPEEDVLAFARGRGFGLLLVNGPQGPLVAHVPFTLTPDGKVAEMHLVRSNAIVRALGDGLPALLAVSGPDGYISPDWYGIDDQVPTWNYIAAHLRGTLEPLPDTALRGQLDRLSEVFEARLEPKTPWKADKMPAELLSRMMRSICAVRLTIASVDGTWKLTQNKPEAARLAAAGRLTADTPGQETAALAALMRDPPA